jgi:hypothetical protein
MPTYKIIFERTEIRKYEAIVEAEDKYEAEDLFKSAPFDYTDDDGEIEDHYQVEIKKITEKT